MNRWILLLLAVAWLVTGGPLQAQVLNPGAGAVEATTADRSLEPQEMTFRESATAMRETMRRLWEGFVRHLPLLIAGLAVIVLTAFIARLVRFTLRKIIARSRFRRSLRELLEQLAYVATWIVGLTVAAVLVFPNLTPTKALGGLGILSLAVGFAFKDIFENFFAGVILLWRFPFEPGDFIECEGITGRIEDITIRNTLLRKVTDELVIMPNSFLFTNPVDVLTHRSERRATIVVGVAYGVRVEEAVAVIGEAVRQCPSVSRKQEPQIFPQEFGESSINIEVAWWCDSTPLGQRRSRGEVVTAIKRLLDERGLEIPFPYRTLTFKEPLRVESTFAGQLGERATNSDDA